MFRAKRTARLQDQKADKDRQNAEVLMVGDVSMAMKEYFIQPYFVSNLR